MKQQKAPKQDNSGYGLKAGVGKDKDYKKSEQDGQNRLGPADVLYDRERVAGNE